MVSVWIDATLLNKRVTHKHTLVCEGCSQEENTITLIGANRA